ncbi:hypothetical protein HDU76_001113, partial [Blyttiomyces sp. JEL0837]
MIKKPFPRNNRSRSPPSPFAIHPKTHKSSAQLAAPHTAPAAKIIPILESSGLWPGLDKAALSSIANEMDIVEFNKGEVICREGETSGYLFVLIEGSAEAFKRVDASNKDSENVKLITLKAGEYIGETPLLEGSPLTATLIASETPTRALRLSNVAFKQLLDSNPVISTALLRGLSAELRSFRTVLARTIAATTGTTSLSKAASAVSIAVDTNAADSIMSKVDLKVIRMAVFDFMKHEKHTFEETLGKFKDTLDPSKYVLEVQYLDCKLDAKTVRLAAGCQVVSIFVNDTANAEVLTLLSAQGVQLVALRCAGFDNVDLKVAAALGITVARVPAYSPYAVAEFAATLAVSLNRKIVPAYTRVRQGNFSLAGLVGFDFHGKTVGVIGTGK